MFKFKNETVDNLKSDVDLFIENHGGLNQSKEEILDMQMKAFRETDFVSRSKKLSKIGFGTDPLVSSILVFAEEHKHDSFG